MKKKIYSICLALGLLSSVFYACKKNSNDPTSTTSDAELTSAIASTGAISIGTLNSFSSKSSSDSVYVIGCYSGKVKKDTVAQSGLPTGIGTYLTANYAGFTFKRAYKITDASNTLTAYIVIVKFNKKPVGLKFDASGNFVKVLEQREGKDLRGKGWHEGGEYEHRDGKHRDTIALSSLPAPVTNFLKTNYPSDTLLHASLAKDTNYVLISKNNGLFATVVTPSGALIKRVAINNQRLSKAEITQTALATNVADYLNTTYPAYVFDKAYVIKKGTAIEATVVFFTSNNTKYAIIFNSNGSFNALFVLR